MKIRSLVSATAAGLLLAAGPAMSLTGAELAGQKINSGLGELPHHSTWADPSGRDPLGRAPLRLAANQR